MKKMQTDNDPDKARVHTSYHALVTLGGMMCERLDGITMVVSSSPSHITPPKSHQSDTMPTFTFKIREMGLLLFTVFIINRAIYHSYKQEQQLVSST